MAAGGSITLHILCQTVENNITGDLSRKIMPDEKASRSEHP